MANAASLVLNVATTSILAKSLGPAQFGWYSFAMTAAGFMLVICRFGSDSIITREVAQKTPDSSGLITSALLLRCVLFVAVAAGTILLAPHVAEGSDAVLSTRIATLFVLASGISTLSDAFFQAHLRLIVPSAIKVGGRLVLFGAVYLYAPQNPVMAVECTVIAELMGATVALFALWNGSRFSLRCTPNQFYYLIKESLPLALTTVAIMTYLRFDVLILSQLAPATALGLYSGANRLVEVLGGIASVLGITVYPIFSRLIGGKEELQSSKVYSQAAVGLMAALLPICIWYTVFAKSILVFALGDAYGAAVPVLRILIWSQVFASIGVLYSNYAIAEKRQKLVLSISLCSASVNLGLNFALIPSLGITGASIATLISYGVCLPILAFMSSGRSYVLPVFGALLEPGIASLVMLLIAIPLKESFILGSLISTGVYMAVFFSLARRNSLRYARSAS